MAKHKIVDASVAIIREVAAAPGNRGMLMRDEWFTGAPQARAFLAVLEAGYATRLGPMHACVTPAGRAFLAGIDYVVGRL